MAQIVDHRDLISSFQPGDLPASERIVRTYQNEMVRTSFLLTGTAEGAVLLARDAFLRYFRRLVRRDTPDDPRLGLLQALSRCFLIDPEDRHPDNGDRPDRALAGTVSLGAEQQMGALRARVEDDRSRVVSLLDLLDRKTRLGVVLRDFNSLDEEPVCQILDEIPFTLRQKLHPTRDRIRDVAGVGADHSVRELLINAATNAPRPNLWPEVLGPLEEFYAEEDERRQRLTYIAAGAVGLMLILAGLWLFDLLPFVSGNDDAAAVAPTATPTATPEPTITPTPIPDLSSFAIPQGDVPNRLLMILSDQSNTDPRYDYGVFDQETGVFTSYDVGSFPTPSPDGRILVSTQAETASPEGDGSSSLVALDSASGERLWTSEPLLVSSSIAISGGRVYVAALVTTGTGEESTLFADLRAYDLETGELVQAWPGLITNLRTAVSETARVTLIASPDGTRLFVALEELGSGPAIVSSRTLASYSLPDMTFESSSVQTDSTASRQFPVNFSFRNAQVTPDGEFIYQVLSDESAVWFRSSDLSQDDDLPLPFARQDALNEDLQWITSNDGRYLYIIAARSAEVAIVDLLSRRVVRSFPLDFAESTVSQADRFHAQRAPGYGFGAGLSISQNGRQLYLIGISGGTDGTEFESTLWTVDPETWTVTAARTFPGIAINVSHYGDRLILLSDLMPGSSTSDSHLIVIEAASGEITEEFDGAGLPEWSTAFYTIPLHELYRFTYGRAAAVDHLAFEDVEIESTLPRFSVVASNETVPAGKPFDLAVRMLDPVDGQRLAEEQPDVRFDSESTVIVRLIHEKGQGDDVVLVTNHTDPGLYEAGTTLLDAGYWSAVVTITDASGRSRTFTTDKFVQIVPSWEASDGKRYVLRVTTDPAEPTVDETAVVTARFVDIDSGALLPDGVEISATLPDELRVSFDSHGKGVANVTLLRNDDGVYEGDETFWAGGDWQILVELPDETGDLIEVEAGTVHVVQ